MKLTTLDKTALVLTVVGAIDTGLLTAFGFSILAFIISVLTRALSLYPYVVMVFILMAVYVAAVVLPKIFKEK
jgi:uncharacterized membrane protein YuzA (DUF378 family)